MSDPRIVDYLRQNMGKYPVDQLKAALVKQGFPPGDVEAAAALASGDGSAPPPPPAADGPAHMADHVVFGPGRAFANAAALFKDPAGFFSRLDPEGPYGPAVLSIMVWGAISGVITFLLTFVRPSPFGVIAGALQIVLLPLMGALLSWVGAGMFHVICLILGGKAPFKVSYQVIAGMAALFPASTLLGAVPFGTVPVQLYGLYLSVAAAGAAHAVSKGKAWGVFGTLTALGILGSVLAQIGMRDLERRASEPPGLGGAPQAIPQEAAEMLSQLGQGMTPETQKAMQDAMQNPGAILQELTKYGNLAEPPRDTLALLDRAGQARLAKAWPQMSAPMRKSLVETLPGVPEAERAGFMDQMETYTKDLDASVNQAMKLMQQAMDQAEAPKGR